MSARHTEVYTGQTIPVTDVIVIKFTVFNPDVIGIGIGNFIRRVTDIRFERKARSDDSFSFVVQLSQK